jgi:sugar/nucleoside kinase (ribokinase family)
LDDNAPPAVIVYGTVCLDQLIQLDEDGSPRGLPWEMVGGEAFNTATALAGWGIPVLLIGTALGASPDSDRLRRLLDDPPIGLLRHRLPDLPTGVTPVCTIRISPNGERVMQGRGYSEAVAPPPLPDADFASHPIFAIDPNLGEAAVTEALRAASLGCPVVAMDFQQHPDVCRASYLVQTSREHLTRFPLPGGPKRSLEASAEALMAFGTPRLIVTDGANGGIAAERQKEGSVVHWRFPAIALETVVDTTGAGDAFRAGLCWGVLQKEDPWPLSSLIRFANAAAALHCQVLGSGSRIPLDTVQRLAETMP